MLTQTPSLTPDASRRIQSALAAGETMLWTGQPAPARMLRRHAPLLLCGLAVGGGGAAFEWAGAHNHSPLGMAAAAVLTTLGLWTALQGARGASRAARTVYAVTNTRVLIVDGGSGAVVTLTPEQIRARAAVAGPNGRGDLYFDCLDKIIAVEDSRRLERSGFLGIPDVPGIDKLLTQKFGEISTHEN